MGWNPVKKVKNTLNKVEDSVKDKINDTKDSVKDKIDKTKDNVKELKDSDTWDNLKEKLDEIDIKLEIPLVELLYKLTFEPPLDKAKGILGSSLEEVKEKNWLEKIKDALKDALKDAPEKIKDKLKEKAKEIFYEKIGKEMLIFSCKKGLEEMGVGISDKGRENICKTWVELEYEMKLPLQPWDPRPKPWEKPLDVVMTDPVTILSRRTTNPNETATPEITMTPKKTTSFKRNTSPRKTEIPDTRYLGNSNTKEIHDRRRITKACNLDKMIDKNKIYFKSIKEVEKAINNLGYNGCRWCLSKYDTDRG